MSRDVGTLSLCLMLGRNSLLIILNAVLSVLMLSFALQGSLPGMLGLLVRMCHQEKCVLLSTSKSVRRAMKLWDISGDSRFRKVQLDVRELGGHLDFTNRAREGTLSCRVKDATAGVAVVGALPLGFQVKLGLVRGKSIPAGLHGAEASYVSASSLSAFRAAVVWAVRSSKMQLANIPAVLNLLDGPVGVDPALHIIWIRFRTMRRYSVHMMPSAGKSPESPRPGEDCRRLQGRTPLLRTQHSGGWVLRGALRGEQLLAALVSSVDWVVRGTYRTAWAVTPRCCCPHAYGRRVAVGPQTGERSWELLHDLWKAIAPLMAPWCAEGEVPTCANLNFHGGSGSCVRWHRDDESVFGMQEGVQAHRFGEWWVFSAFPLGISAWSGL